MGRSSPREMALCVFSCGDYFLLLLSMGTVAIRWVQVKICLRTIRARFQVISNAGRQLARTTAQAAAKSPPPFATEPEVTDTRSTSAWRHHSLQRTRTALLHAGCLLGRLQVNLVNNMNARRRAIYCQTRAPPVAAIAERLGARVAVAEVPALPSCKRSWPDLRPSEESHCSWRRRCAAFPTNPGGVE